MTRSVWQRATVVGLIPIWGHEIFLVYQRNSQHAIPRQFGLNWRTECINTTRYRDILMSRHFDFRFVQIRNLRAGKLVKMHFVLLERLTGLNVAPCFITRAKWWEYEILLSPELESNPQLSHLQLHTCTPVPRRHQIII